MPPALRPLALSHLAKPTIAAPNGVVGVRDARDGRKLACSDDPFDPDALVFTTSCGCPVTHNNFRKNVFRPTQKLALPHLPKLRWHDLRHTCASLCLSIEPNLNLVKQRLGHEDIRTTINTYGYMVPSIDEALADRLGELFEARQPENVVALRR